ncbi:PREDICTED: vesicle-associated membrane protein 1 [Sturnus vulgaris]|uniref:vesicle-associated membrane protein 1 n=1 Tax=Sturnus vulgaris TaxID=9172 RepID=UPI00071A2771|nr:PREDICTED: vesicle-associated membrane protein 1 [Sturnus vulgaris]
MCGSPVGGNLARGHHCAQPGSCLVPSGCPRAASLSLFLTFLPRLLVTSDPAQQPAPGAPEGGAPEGGAPEGAAPGGGPPGAPPNLTSNRRLQQTQAQVQEVVDIMCVNVDKVLQRDEKLSELDDRADALQAGASVFESSAAKLKRKYWWKNCKMMIIMGVIGALVVVVIALQDPNEDLP